MAWNELINFRNQKVKYYQDDVTGQSRAIFSFHDQHYHDGSAWQNVDENLSDDTLTGYTHKADKLKHIIHIATGGGRRWIPRRDYLDEYIQFGQLQSWNGSSWVNVNLGTPTRTDNHIVWDTANFSLTLEVNWHRVKIIVVLKTEAARRRLRWAVTLNGLTYDQGDLRAVSDNALVGRVEKPMAWDATQNPNARPFHYNVPITTTYAGGFIEFGGDLSAAVLPVTIDPTLTSQPDATAGIDGWTEQGNPDVAHATEVEIDSAAKTFGGGRVGLLKFDLSSIPGGATVTSSILSLFIGCDGDGTTSIHRILAANSGWVEGATWNYANPSTVRWAGDTDNNGGSNAGCSISGTDYNGTAMGSVALLSANPMANANITLDNTQTEALIANNYGICSQHTHFLASYFWSSDYSTASLRPKLVIDYTTGGAAAAKLQHLLLMGVG